MAQLNPRIEAKLKQIPAAAVDAARAAMEEGAKEVVSLMRASVKEKTGKLRNSINWTWGDLPPGTFMIDEIRSGQNKGDQYATLRIKIYAGSREAFYARFIEFGTRPHSLQTNASVDRELRQDEGVMHPGTPAWPFFYPSWKTKKAEFRRLVQKRVREAIREAWRNG